MSNRFRTMDRRRFLKRGVEAGTLIVTFPLWENAWACPEGLLDSKAPAPFILPQDGLRKLLEIALSRGGNFAEIYMEHTVSNSIGLDENVVSGASRNVDMGVGFRVLKGETTGYAFSDVLEFDRLKAAAETAALVASGAAAPVGSFRPMRPPSYYLVKVPPDSIAASEKVALLRKANETARAHDPRIKEVGVGFNDMFKRFAIANSEGLYVEDSQTLTGFGVNCNAIDGVKRSVGSESKDGGYGFEHFDLALAGEMGKRAAEAAIRMLPAEDAPAGEFPVVIAKGYGGIFFHEAIGHSLEADAIRRKSSCFWDKLGTPIASPAVTLYDDGTWKGGWGSVNVDDEGQPGHKTVLIDKGICASFLQDRLSAGIMKMAPTGNGRRMSFRYDPIPRMTNTYLTTGTSEPEEIVRSVDKGIYIAKIGGGNVSSTTGRFVFEVPEAHLIEGGKVTRPLKGIMLMGNGQDILKNISLVASDLEVIGGGQCGKGGQGKPTGFGNPTFKVTKITVGGSRA
jgi:TldD protein